MKITLTIDNGPDPVVTPEVLDILALHGVPATFFVLGKNLKSPVSRGLLERIMSQGHVVGNHTFSHEVPLGLMEDSEAAIKEIAETQALLEKNGANKQRLFRPFGGGGHVTPDLFSQQAWEYLIANQFSCALWNCVPRDWLEPDDWVRTALEDIRNRDWSVVVVHDLPTGAMANLEEFIVQARLQGYTFVQEFPDSCMPMLQGKANWASTELRRVITSN
jgi:peptidoglycan/xylan/chitin deacetylase (PgdA/CDA1 family)